MIEVRIEGVTFKCSTVEEALSLARALGTLRPSPRDEPPPMVPRELERCAWRQPVGLDVYWGRLSAKSRETIRAIATHEGLSIGQLCETLGLASTKEVSHVLAACKRTAVAVGILDYRDVFTHRISGARDARVSFYYPGRLLREVGAQTPSASLASFTTVPSSMLAQ